MFAPAERLAEKTWVAPWLQHEHIARYNWAARLSVGRTVLDAACGTGYGSLRLLEGGAARVDGFDLSDEAIAEARRLHQRPRMTFGTADVTRLPCRDHTYDVFCSFETIEHVPDDLALLREAKRVLKPGGTFACSTPNRTVTNPGISITGRPYNRFHLREYTRADLDTLLREVFPRVTWLGQSFWHRGYVRALNYLGSLSHKFAFRCHQCRKVFGMPWEKLERHLPMPLPGTGEPEVLVAVCEVPNR